MNTKAWMSGILLLAAAQANAAGISWSVQLLGDGSEVSTNGTLVDAANFGNATYQPTPEAMVNGVTFANVGSLTATIHPPNLTSSPNFRGPTGNTAAYAGATAAYDDLLDGFVFTRAEESPVLTLTGLTSGHDYEVQVFAVDNRNDSSSRYGLADGGTTHPVRGTDTTIYGAVWTGTFTADATTQDFTFQLYGEADDLSDGSHINAYQLRDISATGPTLLITEFSYDPDTVDGSAELSLEGEPDTNYKFTMADDLDFSTADPVILTGANPGIWDDVKNEVTTDGDGKATVQFNLGTDPKNFVRAETP